MDVPVFVFEEYGISSTVENNLLSLNQQIFSRNWFFFLFKILFIILFLPLSNYHTNLSTFILLHSLNCIIQKHDLCNGILLFHQADLFSLHIRNLLSFILISLFAYFCERNSKPENHSKIFQHWGILYTIYLTRLTLPITREYTVGFLKIVTPLAGA